jgi:hypothetical protein
MSALTQELRVCFPPGPATYHSIEAPRNLQHALYRALQNDPARVHFLHKKINSTRLDLPLLWDTGYASLTFRCSSLCIEDTGLTPSTVARLPS